MDPGVLSTLSALGGTAIGALASLGTTWMTTTSQSRAARLTADRAKREALYAAFIEKLSKLYAESTTRVGIDYAILSDVYALGGQITLFASAPVAASAKRAVRYVVDVATGPALTDDELRKLMDQPEADVIMAFADACRVELSSLR